MNNINISNTSIFRLCIWAAGVYALFYFKDLIIVIIISIFLSILIEPLINIVRKIRILSLSMSRVSAVSIVFLIIFFIIFLLGYFLLPILIKEIIILLNNLPKFIEGLSLWKDNQYITDISNILTNSSINFDIKQVLPSIEYSIIGIGKAWSTTGALLQNIINILLTIIFTFYFSIEEKGVENCIRLISPADKSAYIISIWNRAERKIGDWASGQLITATIVGVIVLISLLLANMPYAVIFALLSFFGEMIPLVGLLLSSIPAIIVAGVLINFNYAIIIAIIFFVISQIENYIIYPKIMSNRVGVPSLVVLLSILIGLKLLGFWGVVLAVPVAAVIVEYFRDLRRINN